MSDFVINIPRFNEAFDILKSNKSNEDEVCKCYIECYKRFGFDFMETPDSLQTVLQKEKDMITNMKKNLKNLIKQKVLSIEEYNGIIKVNTIDFIEFKEIICETKKFRIGMRYIYVSDNYEFEDIDPKKLLKDIWIARFKYTTIKKQADAVINEKIDTTPEQQTKIKEYYDYKKKVPVYLFKHNSGTEMTGFCPICYDMTWHGIPEGRVIGCQSRSTKCKGWDENKKQHEVHKLIHGVDEYFLAPGNVILHED